MAVILMIAMKCDADLAEIVAASRCLGRGADALNGRHQEAREDRQNRHHHQRFHER